MPVKRSDSNLWSLSDVLAVGGEDADSAYFFSLGVPNSKLWPVPRERRDFGSKVIEGVWCELGGMPVSLVLPSSSQSRPSSLTP